MVMWPSRSTMTMPLGQASTASRNFSSASLRSVMSRVILDAPMIAPDDDLTGDTLTATSMRRPSLPTRTVSK